MNKKTTIITTASTTIFTFYLAKLARKQQLED